MLLSPQLNMVYPRPPLQSPYHQPHVSSFFPPTHPCTRRHHSTGKSHLQTITLLAIKASSLHCPAPAPKKLIFEIDD